MTEPVVTDPPYNGARNIRELEERIRPVVVVDQLAVREYNVSFQEREDITDRVGRFVVRSS